MIFKTLYIFFYRKCRKCAENFTYECGCVSVCVENKMAARRPCITSVILCIFSSINLATTMEQLSQGNFVYILELTRFSCYSLDVYLNATDRFKINKRRISTNITLPFDQNKI